MMRERGLTLIELTVAMAIVAVLGILSYQGLAHVLNGRRVLHEELQRWRDIGRALHILDTELLQCATVSLPSGALGLPAMHLQNRDGQRDLDFLALGGVDLGARRVDFHFENGQLTWRRWDDRNERGQMREDLILAGVQNVRWRFLYQGQYSDHWPPETAMNQVMPDAAELQLDLADVGTITRLFALH